MPSTQLKVPAPPAAYFRRNDGGAAVPEMTSLGTALGDKFRASGGGSGRLEKAVTSRPKIVEIAG